MDKAAYLLAVREVLPEVLNEFPTIDAFVNPLVHGYRLIASKFKKPVLTVNEFKVISGEFTWENVLKKGLFES